MGIQGLLPLLKSIMVPIHMKELEGCCVAVDTYSWLHKGALSCSKELCKGLATSRHIEYCMHRVNLLRHYGVKPILVFDGGLLPMKMDQENKRARSRKENLARAVEHEANGNSAAAFDCYQKAVDISPSIAHDLIQVLKQENVSYVVAPYEADAQMTFLALTKQVDAVITEDSDLIPFGCQRIIFKMDKFGQGVEFRSSMLHKNKDLSFVGFSQQMLLEMCILSGCDYLQSLSGMGLKRAHALISRFKSYDRVIKHLRYSTVSVPPLYEESFRKAILTFKHQRVYDPKTEDILHLSDMPDGLGDDSEFLGPSIPQHIAKGIADGNLDPFTRMPFQKGEDISPKFVSSGNSHPKSSKPESQKKKLDLPVQKNVLTKYFCFASLEAKRKFRVPRISPKCLSPTDDSSNTPEEQLNLVAGSNEANDSLASSSQSDSPEDVSPANSLGENGSAIDVSTHSEAVGHDGRVGPETSLLLRSGNLMHKPYPGSQIEVDDKHVGEKIKGTIKMESMKVVVRSKYFQHKRENKIHQDNKEQKPCLKDCSFFAKNCDKKDFMEEVEASAEKESRKVLVRSPYFQHKKANEYHQEDRDENLIMNHNDLTDDYKNATEEVEGAMHTERRRVGVSSAYFQHTQIGKSHQGGEDDNLFVRDVSQTDIAENTIPLGAFSSNNCFKGMNGKRKSFLDDNLQTENLNPKHMRTNEISGDNGCCDADIGKTFSETESEGKFGSNISHLSRYSEIAEKSVERFVSAISSFRYNSSGSRASGLRPPLKDVRNTSPNGSSVKLDFNQFAYVPSSRKTSATSQRS